jgi:hypothetical protein
MGSLEDHYRQQAAAQQAAAEPDYLKYNRLADVITEIRDTMLKQVHRKPPEQHDWIWIASENESKIGWSIVRTNPEEVTDTLHLLSDGRIVGVHGESRRTPQGVPYIRLVGTQFITIAHLNRSMTDEELLARRMPVLSWMRNIARSMVSSLPCNYGFSDDPREKRWWAETR